MHFFEGWTVGLGSGALAVLLIGRFYEQTLEAYRREHRLCEKCGKPL